MNIFVLSLTLLKNMIHTYETVSNHINCFSVFCDSVDATEMSGLGRMINDSPYEYANSVMKREVLGKEVHLCLYAKKSIQKGTEIR